MIFETLNFLVWQGRIFFEGGTGFFHPAYFKKGEQRSLNEKLSVSLIWN